MGDETISTDRVDDLADSYCGAVESQIAANGQSFPLSGFKTGIATQLALKSAADQIADEYDVKLSDDYKIQLAQIEDAAAPYKGSDRDAFIEVQATQPYYVDLLTQVGAIKLKEEGDRPDGRLPAGPGSGRARLLGGRRGLRVRPEVRHRLVDGVPTPVDTDVSYAFGDNAKLGKADGDPDPGYVASLPLSATCG